MPFYRHLGKILTKDIQFLDSLNGELYHEQLFGTNWF